jgi:hypothetical protein
MVYFCAEAMQLTKRKAMRLAHSFFMDAFLSQTKITIKY